MAKILIAEDESNTANMLKDWLESHQFSVDVANDGKEALDYAFAYDYDLFILDWDLPHVSGIEIIKDLRGKGRQNPVLLLTGKNQVADKETGFYSGADDYLTKPCDLRELLARVRALIRRASAVNTDKIVLGNLVLDRVAHKLLKNEIEIALSPREFDLIEFFMRNPNQVFSPEALLNRVWPSDSDSTPGSIRTCIKKLRAKLDQPDERSIIVNLPGVGYRLDSL